jgi:replicative DNA helicase
MEYWIMNEQQLPPHDIAAEEAVLSCLMIDGDKIQEISLLESKDFYHEPLRDIYAICLDLYRHGTAINQITVGAEEERLGKSNLCGGVSYLLHLESLVGSSLDIGSYADIVRNLSISRQLIELGGKCIKIGYSANPDGKQSIQTIYEMIREFKKNTMPFEGLVTPKEASNIMLEFIHKFNEPHKKLSWGFRDLNSVTSGIYPAELIIIGARPSVGKTQLMLDIMELLAISGKTIMFCSAEMSLTHILERRVARELGVGILDLRNKGISAENEQALMKLIGENAERHVYYMRKGTSSDDIMSEAVKMKDSVGLDIIFVDYLQFLSDCWQSTGENQNVRVGKASKTLKNIANELEIPVVVASQLNRGLEHRGEADRRPTLADLRDSGNIEQDADVVFLLDRISVTTQGHVDNTRLSVKMAKNRQIGSMPAIELKFNTKRQRYEDCEVGRRSTELPPIEEPPVDSNDEEEIL